MIKHGFNNLDMEVVRELMEEGMGKREAMMWLADMNGDPRTAYALGYRNDRASPHDHTDMGYDAHDDRSARLKSPHYTEERYKHAQTIYGRWSEQLGYDYDDRIPGWFGYENWTAGQTKATDMDLPPASVVWFEAAMSYAYGLKPDETRPVEVDPVTLEHRPLLRRFEIRHVLAGYNLSSGHPYRVFGYLKLNPPSEHFPR